ncbi:pyridoxal-phosphate dependent enzyme [candidate division KSB1 bacterium]|nr:pyridoxal-phosphate dependent enzyme [candidate division KSB1 bacterium]
MQKPTITDIDAAQQRIGDHIHRTPVYTSATIDRWSGKTVFFKLENLQKTGAFKLRGACNAVLCLSTEQAQKGVATHSSGNHAAALAYAASLRQIPAFVVMPENAPANKIAAVREYGGQITFCRPTLKAREKSLIKVCDQTGAVFIHPYDHPDVIAGQGTACLEFLDQVEELDAILIPIGGGGLAAGTAIAAQKKSIPVIACEPEMANDAYISFIQGERVTNAYPDTIADGLRTLLSPLTFAVVKESVQDIVCVSEKEIIRAWRMVLERMKWVVEPSAAVPVAALIDHPDRIPGNRIGIILSGGNIDLTHLPRFDRN